MYVAVVCILCSARSFSCFSCIVLAVLTTRLTDSVDHPSPRNTLAVATLVITIAGLLRTNTLGCRRITSQEAPVPLDSPRQLIPATPCMRLERPGTWLHGGSVGRDVGFLGMPQLPPEHGDVAGGYLLANRQEHASTPHALLTW